MAVEEPLAGKARGDYERRRRDVKWLAQRRSEGAGRMIIPGAGSAGAVRGEPGRPG